MDKIKELLQEVLDIAEKLDSNNEDSLTTDLQEDIYIFLRSV
tara:strand:+ start:384 stop:509 length:126 start_codon:yes stop_codon:yes gene_type:complete